MSNIISISSISILIIITIVIINNNSTIIIIVIIITTTIIIIITTTTTSTLQNIGEKLFACYVTGKKWNTQTVIYDPVIYDHVQRENRANSWCLIHDQSTVCSFVVSFNKRHTTLYIILVMVKRPILSKSVCIIFVLRWK